MNENKIDNVEKYTLGEVVEMMKILSEKNNPDDNRIKIKLDEKGIHYKT